LRAASTIRSTDGRTIVLGGAGADDIATGRGDDVILGDNGIILRDPTGSFLDAITSTIEAGIFRILAALTTPLA
jgi:hypothetical protein